MTKAERILEKHLSEYDTTDYTDEDIKLKKCYLNAINEALNTPVNIIGEVNIEHQVKIVKEVIRDMMITFDSEDDRLDYILDFVNGYKEKLLNNSEI